MLLYGPVVAVLSGNVGRLTYGKFVGTGESVYGEKRISVEGPNEGEKIEYRVWNPFRSKLAASVLAGVDNIHIKPGSKVLYLGAASGTSVSHVSDVVGPDGVVYAVEFSHRSGESVFVLSFRQVSIYHQSRIAGNYVVLWRSAFWRACAELHTGSMREVLELCCLPDELGSPMLACSCAPRGDKAAVCRA